MKLIIDLPDKTIAHIRSDYGHKYFGAIRDDDKKIIMKAIYDGTPLEEISNPCIECSQNCCVCELNGEKCECQKVYIVKENKE